jgi:hypothetical protein
MVGIRVDDEAAATLSALPGVSCAYWYFFDGVLCDIRTSWDDPDQLDWCWLRRRAMIAFNVALGRIAFGRMDASAGVGE